jgi:hypothetical protein
LGQNACSLAVADHIGELVGLGRWIDRHGRGAGLQDRKERDRRFPAIVHEDENAIAAHDTARGKRRGQPSGCRIEFRIGEALVAGHQSRLCAVYAGAILQKLFDAHRLSPVA